MNQGLPEEAWGLAERYVSSCVVDYSALAVIRTGVRGTTLIAAAEPITIKQIVLDGSLGAERIVFGTNSPSGVAENGVKGIRGIGFSPEDEALILGGNIEAIYGL